MKNIIIVVSIVVVAVVIATIILSQANKQKEASKLNPILPMAGAPCHQMGGQWMGDCEFDNNGSVIPTNL
tara:strand:+ start:171 stop:380 length:210 start_codon:yes stop_codon:yes gene_type:complete